MPPKRTHKNNKKTERLRRPPSAEPAPGFREKAAEYSRQRMDNQLSTYFLDTKTLQGKPFDELLILFLAEAEETARMGPADDDLLSSFSNLSNILKETLNYSFVRKSPLKRALFQAKVAIEVCLSRALAVDEAEEDDLPVVEHEGKTYLVDVARITDAPSREVTRAISAVNEACLSVKQWFQEKKEELLTLQIERERVAEERQRLFEPITGLTAKEMTNKRVLKKIQTILNKINLLDASANIGEFKTQMGQLLENLHAIYLELNRITLEREEDNGRLEREIDGLFEALSESVKTLRERYDPKSVLVNALERGVAQVEATASGSPVFTFSDQMLTQTQLEEDRQTMQTIIDQLGEVMSLTGVGMEHDLKKKTRRYQSQSRFEPEEAEAARPEAVNSESGEDNETVAPFQDDYFTRYLDRHREEFKDLDKPQLSTTFRGGGVEFFPGVLMGEDHFDSLLGLPEYLAGQQKLT